MCMSVVHPTQNDLGSLQHTEIQDTVYAPSLNKMRHREQESGRERGSTKRQNKPSQDADGGKIRNDMFWRATASIVKMTEDGANEEALLACERLLAANPLSVDALQLKGLALHLLGRYRVAVRLLIRVMLR